MLHLSELHGAATHLAIVAVPVYVLVSALRRLGRAHPALAPVEPWTLGASVVGVALAGGTGLLVSYQAETVLRGEANRVGTAHFWLGIALAVVLVAVTLVRYLALRRGRHGHGIGVLAAGLVALGLVLVQGYLGGRMTYDQGVGVASGGQFAQTALGAQQLNLALARGEDQVAAGRSAFSAEGLGCARCHGMKAQGLRGPALGGGVDLEDFRNLHGAGLFPPAVVTDRDFDAINGWLRTLPKRPPGPPG